MKERYPRLEINLAHLKHNVAKVVEKCGSCGIQVAGVIKGATGLVEVAKQFDEGGAAFIASSRLEQIEDARDAGIEKPMMLIRIPMLSEIQDVIRLADISLNSELEVLKALNEEAKKQGKIRFIGITNHRLAVAHEAIDSGLYDTLQFPFSYLSSEKEAELTVKCKEKDMGFLAMKALAGGLINCAEVAYAFMNQYDNVLPIWGIQRERELDEFLACQENPPQMEGEIAARIEKDRQEIVGDFCRGCGYCMPCPAGIEINNCARMSLLLRRSPYENLLGAETQAKMKKIEECKNCGHCKSKCPYGLDTPELLKKNYKDYQEILAGKKF